MTSVIENNIEVMERNEEELGSGCDPYVEHLRQKYLQHMVPNSSGKDSSSGSFGQVISNDILSCTPASSLTESERKHYTNAMAELKKLLKLGETKLEETVAQYQSSIKQKTEAEQPLEDHNEEQDDLENVVLKDTVTTLTQSTTLPTMSSEFTTDSYKPQKSVRISAEPTTFLESEFSTGLEATWPGPGILRLSSRAEKFEPTDVKVIHAELLNIHQKLNDKSKHLSELQAYLDAKEEELLLREDQLAEQEQNIAVNEERVQKAQDVMLRLQGVETKVEEKFSLLQECHTAEINQLQSALSEKLKECKRLKSSFDVIKSHNEELKLQDNELARINQKLYNQNTKLKRRLENLQRKQQYTSQKKCVAEVLADQTNKFKLDDNKLGTSASSKSVDKSSKVWNNSIEALSVCLEWISEIQLKPSDDFKMKHNGQHISKDFITDKCLKVLPLLVEVLRYLPVCTAQSKHHLPYLRFIYCSLHHLEDTHHALLSSTARRIGEELIKPSSFRSISETTGATSAVTNTTLPYSGAGNDSKTKPQVFFHSTNIEVRMVSSFIILKTLHQVDILAQVFDQLKKDLQEEDNRKIFLHYAATQTILPYLTYKTNKSLIGNTVDVMLQMAMESSLLPAFLKLCSCETWFRAVSSAVRTIGQSSDFATLEKLSIILQKLSKIKTNKKYFESLSLGRALQERYRECDPESTFLSLNLRSILFNLNLLKTNSIPSI